MSSVMASSALMMVINATRNGLYYGIKVRTNRSLPRDSRAPPLLVRCPWAALLGRRSRSFRLEEPGSLRAANAFARTGSRPPPRSRARRSISLPFSLTRSSVARTSFVPRAT